MPSNSRPTKAERRAAARAKARAMREEQERRARRAMIGRRAAIGVGALAVLGVGGALWYDSRQTSAAGGSLGLGAIASGDGYPAGIREDSSWTFGSSFEPGSVNSGGSVVEIFFDYSCHACADFDALHLSELKALAQDNKATIVLRPTRALGQEWTDLVMNSLGVVLDEQPKAALDFHHAAMSLFSRIYAAQNASMMTVANLVAAATEAGVDAGVTAKFADAVSEARYGEWVTNSEKVRLDAKVSATPWVVIDGNKAELAAIATATGITDAIGAG